MENNFKKEYTTLSKVEADILAINKKNLLYKREDFDAIPRTDNRVMGIFGERGVGKTTLLLQKRIETDNAFYFSADSAIIKSIGLYNFVMYCVFEMGIKTLFIDEIFRYDNRKQEIKNCIDSFLETNFYFSGSSSMALYDGVIDLGRRIYVYQVHTLSFREFLKLKYHIDLPKITFSDLLQNHEKLSMKYSISLKNKYFEEYLKMWAYPFGLNLNYNSFINHLQNVLDRVIMEDLKYINSFETQSLDRLSRLIYFISTSTPSELSVNQLSQKIALNQAVVDNTLYLLNKIGAVHLVPKWENLSQKVRKEYKILLGDTNKYFVNNLEPEIGTIREAFFVSEIKKLNTHFNKLEISVPRQWDFKVEFLGKESYYFEVGGKNKKSDKYPKETFIIKDNIEISENQKTIPLRLLGFLN